MVAADIILMKGEVMFQHVEARLSNMFEHHAIITLPNGTMFQVPRSAVEEHRDGTLVLRVDSVIEHVFTKSVPKPNPLIHVPESVVARLPV